MIWRKEQQDDVEVLFPYGGIWKGESKSKLILLVEELPSSGFLSDYILGVDTTSQCQV